MSFGMARDDAMNLLPTSRKGAIPSAHPLSLLPPNAIDECDYDDLLHMYPVAYAVHKYL